MAGHELRSGLVEDGDGVLHELHFRQREQEGERGFRALVLVDPVHVQGIAAAAGSGE